MIDFITSHVGVLSAVGVAVLDLVFALNPKWQSNGILHWVFVQLQSLGKQQPPAAS